MYVAFYNFRIRRSILKLFSEWTSRLLGGGLIAVLVLSPRSAALGTARGS